MNQKKNRKVSIKSVSIESADLTNKTPLLVINDIKEDELDSDSDSDRKNSQETINGKLTKSTSGKYKI